MRVDSSYLIGTGHVMRCLTLGEILRERGVEVQFICRNLEGNMISVIESQSYKVFVLSKPENAIKGRNLYDSWLEVSWMKDADETIQTLQETPQVMVIDHYALDYRWHQAVRPYTHKIFVIDDLANRKHDCDYLLDQNIHLNMHGRYNGLVPDHCKQFIGPQFALLRSEFRKKHRANRKITSELKRIFVFFGGTDPTNETLKVLRSLEQISLDDCGIEIDVVVGKVNSHIEHIRNYCLNRPNYHFHVQVNNISDLMMSADLAIGAGGTTVWERCYLGLPSILISVAENQTQICKALEQAGVAIYLGESQDVSEVAIANEIIRIKNNPHLLKFMRDTSYRLMDGYEKQFPSMINEVFFERN
jgi:UDP-2,4-diacetamido-2,4,6-trideoxy-beta-L-altropyranose hydrolase